MIAWASTGRSRTTARATASELADATGTHERYTREWLEQQAVAGILEVESADTEPEERRYLLPEGHDEVLLERDSLYFVAPFAQQMVSITRPLPAVLEAFRTGGGVPYPDYGEDMREGIAYGNRPMFVNLMGTEWLPAIPDIHERLQADPPARVADIGCGAGWSSISIARAYPKVRVDGFDLDEDSIAEAKANAEAEDLTDRVTFQVRDAADPELSGRYDLAIAIECIHDMGRPVEALRAMRFMVGKDGAVLVVDERVGEDFIGPERRDRAADVRLQHRALPAGGDGRAALGGHGHRDAPCDAATLRDRSGLLGSGDPAHRERLVALLPTGDLTLIHRSAWKGNSPQLNFRFHDFCEVRRDGVLRSSARKRRAEAMMLPALPLLLALIH